MLGLINNSTKLPIMSTTKGNLINQLQFDPEKLQKYYLDKPFLDSKAFIKEISLKLGISAHHVFEHDVLRFCEECLKHGYHSNFHQLRFMERCPIHESILLNRCPSCSRMFFYNLNNPSLKEPYKCACRYSLANFIFIDNAYTNFKNQFEIIDSFKTKLTQIKNNPLVSNLVFLKQGDVSDREIGKHIDRIFQFIFYDKMITGNYTNINFTSLSAKKSLNKQELNNCFNIITESYKDQKAIYKSIARNIRKNHMHYHRSCIRKLTINMDHCDVCHHAEAYVCWRKFIEGLSDYSNVQNGRSKRLLYVRTPVTFYSPLFESYISSIELHVENKLNKIVNELKYNLINNPKILSRISNRIFAELVMFTFYNLLDIYKDTKKDMVTQYFIFPIDPENLINQIYIDYSNLKNNQVMYISFNKRIQKPKLWCSKGNTYK